MYNISFIQNLLHSEMVLNGKVMVADEWYRRFTIENCGFKSTQIPQMIGRMTLLGY